MASLLVPTTRAARLAALAAPVALLIAVAAPTAWIAVPVAAAAMLLLVLVDGLLAGELRDWRLDHVDDAEVGTPSQLTLAADIGGARKDTVRAALASDPRLAPGGRIDLTLEGENGAWLGQTELVATRRGTAKLDRLWLSWTGPLGLGARQASFELERDIRIWPDLSPIRSQPLQALLRDNEIGMIARRRRGEGTQFEALAEYQPGMDRRRIDWKASARHTHLLARENESERNNQIVLAFDCGQAMCEPIDGLPRIDRAVSAGLTAAYVALKGSDRVMLYGFARRPLVASPFIADTRGFPKLQQAAAALDYRGGEEPNFTLALATLSSKIKRRSLIVLFSDLSDPDGAELMIESLGRLANKHAVVFVSLEDRELADLRGAAPESLEAMARAVTAEALARQKALVFERLRQLGIDVIEAPYDALGFAVIDRYLSLRSREAIAG